MIEISAPVERPARHIQLISDSDEIVTEEGVWFRLIGPFFKERVMVLAAYIYEGKEDTSAEKYPEELWLDEHWLVYWCHIHLTRMTASRLSVFCTELRTGDKKRAK